MVASSANKGDDEMKFYANLFKIGTLDNNGEHSVIEPGTIFSVHMINGNMIELKQVQASNNIHVFVDCSMIKFAFRESEYLE